MKRKYLLIALVSFTLINTNVWGQSAKKKTEVKEKTEAKDSVNAYDKLIKESEKSVHGMFTLHKIKQKVYFQIPIEMFGKEMLIASTVSKTSDNGHGIVGSKGDPLHITFTKSGELVHVRRLNRSVVSDNSSSGIAGAIANSSIGSIMRSMKIEAYSKDSLSVVVDMTPFFTGDNKDLTPFDIYSKYTMFYGLKRSESFSQDKSFLNDIKAFSDNVVVSSTLTYNVTLTDQRTNQVVVKDQPFTAVVTRSIVLLKEKPLRPRFADYRMAIFHTGKQLFSDSEQASRAIYYANRWDLQPSDVEKYRMGQLVEPIKPIVFYIDNNFPESWKPHIKEGVEQWNELFETIGFKNAIKAVEFPTDDPEFDPDNIKYSCVRYAPIGIENAMGPSWVDPRSGEIINASVYIYHDIVKLLNSWMFIQISPAEQRIRTGVLPDDILNDGIRYVVAHEVGHCLGFMHNMSASNVIPTDSLRSPSFTNSTGTTTSIMDYARFNYVAQPGDKERGVKLTPPRFGEYDKFLIKWNYSHFPDVECENKEAEVLSAMVSEAIKEPVYRYGKQLSFALDPRSQAEDLGDDAIKSSIYGIKNLKYLMENFNGWVSGNDPDYKYRTEIYEGIIYQYIRYINHVYASVGGVYLNEVKVADNRPPFESVERYKQIEALKFIMDQMEDLDWLDNKELILNTTLMGSAANLIKTVVGRAIIAAPSKVLLSASLADDPYDFDECSKDVFDFIWAPTVRKENLTEAQMSLQNEYVKGVIGASNVAKLISSSVNIDSNNRVGVTLFDILKDVEGGDRFIKHQIARESMEFVPTAGFGVPSTKFNLVFNFESNFYSYLLKSQEVLKRAVRTRGSAQQKAHYALLLKQIESVLNVQ